MATRRKKSKSASQRSKLQAAARGAGQPHPTSPRESIRSTASPAAPTTSASHVALTGLQHDATEGFPVSVLPAPVRSFIQSQSAALGCQTSAVALPVLSVLAAATASAWQLRLKSDWVEPAILWTAVVSSDPRITEDAARAAVDPLELLQRESLASAQPQGELTERRRTVTSDSTLPQLSRLLQQPARGLLVNSRELDGWFQRARGRSPRAETTRQAWKDLFAARPVVLESSSAKPPLRIESAAVSVTGAVRESTLQTLLRRPESGVGLLSETLIAAPCVVRRGWCEESVPPDVREGYQTVIRRLSQVAPVERPQMPSADQEPTRPRDVVLSDGARRRLIDFANEQAEAEEVPSLEPWAMHRIQQAARLALVIQLARWAAGEVAECETCDEFSMNAAITLVHWFAKELRRAILPLMANSTDPGEIMSPGKVPKTIPAATIPVETAPVSRPSPVPRVATVPWAPTPVPAEPADSPVFETEFGVESDAGHGRGDWDDATVPCDTLGHDRALAAVTS